MHYALLDSLRHTTVYQHSRMHYLRVARLASPHSLYLISTTFDRHPTYPTQYPPYPTPHTYTATPGNNSYVVARCLLDNTKTGLVDVAIRGGLNVVVRLDR